MEETMHNIKLTIEYDGKNYNGWQMQNDVPTIQETLVTAIEKITEHKITLYGSGRTDTGVHAYNQIANFFTNKYLPDITYRKAINYYLPKDIRIKNVEYTDPNFNARFSAKSRTYIYKIFRHETALYRNSHYIFTKDIDLDLLFLETKLLLGEHDFTSFTIKNSPLKHHLCEIFLAQWKIKENELLFTIKANRFLHHMVRVIVGTLMDISTHKKGILSIKDILKSKDRTKAGRTAPPHGLYLYRIEY